MSICDEIDKKWSCRPVMSNDYKSRLSQFDLRNSDTLRWEMDCSEIDSCIRIAKEVPSLILFRAQPSSFHSR